MIRELFVFAYLTYVKIFFSLFSLFPAKKEDGVCLFFWR